VSGSLAVVNRIDPPAADHVRLHGILGERLELLRRNRLRAHEEEFLLWPFQEKLPADPDGQRRDAAPHPEITRGDWHGEFLGTWIATAIVAASNSGDSELASKVDRVLTAWLNTQAEDGYLGTYRVEDRWRSWDVWIQAHDLIGLLVHHELTGRRESLAAAVRVADRVLVDFGPGRRSLQSTGPNAGMASSAILEPILWLHRATGDARYLSFARWIVDEDWESEGGPAIVSSLIRGADPSEIATGKGAEMLILFAGLVELYRSTGNRGYLTAVHAAWERIEARQLYVTGTATADENFRATPTLPNDGVYRVGETCVTMSWLYLSLALGRLTGEAKYFDAVELTAYNHLLAAQSPDGRGWAYYVGLRDSKRYGWHTDPDCCPSRGSRALSLMPQAALGVQDCGIVINMYEASEGVLRTCGGIDVGVRVAGSYPFDGSVQIRLQLKDRARFEIRLRRPSWCRVLAVSINGVRVEPPGEDGYAVLRRLWADEDAVEVSMKMDPRMIVDRMGNSNRVAIARGPLVFAADASYLPDTLTLDDLTVEAAGDEPAASIALVPTPGERSFHLSVPIQVVRPKRRTIPGPSERYAVLSGEDRTDTSQVEVVPFFEAGNRDPGCYDPGVRDRKEPVRKVTYAVWLPVARR
jgi:DUF1680 family protein